MAAVNLSLLCDNKLALEEKHQKHLYQVFRFIAGMSIGIAINKTISTGFGFLTFLPIFFIPTALIVRKKYKKIIAEINTQQNS